MSIIPQISQKDTKYWVALSLFPKFGPRRFKSLREYFNDLQAAFHSDASGLRGAGIPAPLALEFISWRKNIDPDFEMEKLAREQISVVTLADAAYPPLLKEIYDAPPLLYYRGVLQTNTTLCLAVVGSRKYSAYGRRATETIAGGISRAGISIVSGLALGIDALAHETALAQSGATVAVLGSGVNDMAVYPAENRSLARRIISSGGLVLSEFPCGTPGFKYNFPQRNRVIAGLCAGTLVIEASEKSGALITARYALEAGRDVFAVPGDIFQINSAGTNNLIKSGAIMATSTQDILDGLGIANAKATVTARTSLPATQTESDVAALLRTESLHANQLARRLKLDTASLNATLLTMELKGMVRNVGGGNYVLS
jgi:DNA processing protein